MEPFSTGAILSTLKTVWSAMEWARRKFQAPWDDVPFKATIHSYDKNWYSVSFLCLNDKPFEIEVLYVRTVKPKGLLLRKNDGTPQRGMVIADPKEELSLQWTVAEKGAVIFHPHCVVYVNLEGQRGDLSIEFELTVRLLNHRWPEKKVWVRTNTVKLAQ